jgi:hypothetical protein
MQISRFSTSFGDFNFFISSSATAAGAKRAPAAVAQRALGQLDPRLLLLSPAAAGEHSQRLTHWHELIHF